MAVTAIHPGGHLAEELRELGMSAAELARKLDVPTNRITRILNRQRVITGDTALRLAHFFGTSAEFWLLEHSHQFGYHSKRLLFQCLAITWHLRDDAFISDTHQIIGILAKHMATLAKPIPVSECLLRREAVENAVADLRLEGLAPSAEVQSLFARFIEGDLSKEQLIATVLAR